MDRFSQGLPDPQDAEVIDHCLDCGSEIYVGQAAVKYGDGLVCNYRCLASAIGAVTITVGEE